MTDLTHLIGEDLEIASNGNFLLSNNAVEGRERVLRRLLTNTEDAPYHLDYGGSLSLFIGKVMNQANISAKIKAQMRLERAVKRSPLPVVNVAASTDNSVVAQIQYVDSGTMQYSVLEFDTGK